MIRRRSTGSFLGARIACTSASRRSVRYSRRCSCWMRAHRWHSLPVRTRNGSSRASSPWVSRQWRVITVISLGSGAQMLAPRTRKTVLDEMMQLLERQPAGEAALAPVASTAMRLGARVVIITDFLGDADALIAAGKSYAATGAELYATHVVDRGELDPDPKKLLLWDPEHPELRRPMSPPARAVYVRRFAEWRT